MKKLPDTDKTLAKFFLGLSDEQIGQFVRRILTGKKPKAEKIRPRKKGSRKPKTKRGKPL
jgi:hypothetical protein